jgi:hypothetical protein
VFDRVTLHGTTAALLWGYRAVVTIRAWSITKTPKGWTLSAQITASSRWECARAVQAKELLFTAPRDKGRWCWQVLSVDVGTNQLEAVLGQPEQ